MTKNVVVTGGQGFIGSSLCELLIEKDEGLVVDYSRQTYATTDYESEKLIHIEADLLDTLKFAKVLNEYKIDQIYHLAAQTHVDKSFDYPTLFMQTNVFGTVSILEALKFSDVPDARLVYMGTDEVFGEVLDGFSKETDMLDPRNPYSASKASAEHFVSAYHHSFKLNTLIARSMNNYGPRQHPEKLSSKIIRKCLNDEEYTLYGGSSESIRGWIYVTDTADALYHIMNGGKIGEIYHIFANDYFSVEQMNTQITKYLHKEHLFKGYQGFRLKDDERYALSSDCKLANELGWKPKVAFAEGLEKMVKYIRRENK